MNANHAIRISNSLVQLSCLIAHVKRYQLDCLTKVSWWHRHFSKPCSHCRICNLGMDSCKFLLFCWGSRCDIPTEIWSDYSPPQITQWKGNEFWMKITGEQSTLATVLSMSSGEGKSLENNAHWQQFSQWIIVSWKRVRRIHRNNPAIPCLYRGRRDNTLWPVFFVRNCLENVANIMQRFTVIQDDNTNHVPTLYCQAIVFTVLVLKVATLMQPPTFPVRGFDGELHGYRNVNPFKSLNNFFAGKKVAPRNDQPIYWFLMDDIFVENITS